MARFVGTVAGTVAHVDQTSSAEAWFAGGERIGYDPQTHAIVATEDAPLRIFLRQEGHSAHVVSFLPGFPDGSFGWAKVRLHLPSAAAMPKLFLDYVGMGDSDKPKDYAYSSAERTDLVEAIWQNLSIQSTTLVAFDFSSLVVLEILRRRLERAERGETQSGPEIRGVFIFNGGLFTDGHTHPWYTTPMLRRLPDRARRRVGRPFALFKRMPGVRRMWSKDYHLQTLNSSNYIALWIATMVSSSLRRARASWRITKRKAIGSISVISSRLIEASSHSWLAAATKIPLNIGRSISRKNDWENSAFASSVCPAATSPQMSSRKPWQP